MTDSFSGYAGRILRTDLADGTLVVNRLDRGFAQKWIGGNGFGARLLYEEVPAGIEWDDPRSCVVLTTGPLTGTRAGGSGLFSLLFKGPMTNLIGSTQANGFLGAFLKSCGFDAVLLQGVAPDWQYLYLHEAHAELRDARHLAGQDTWQTARSIAMELGIRESHLSVFSIGPAGENLVRFAGLLGDDGHAACRNGIGAVLGAKKLKAIAVARGGHQIRVHDPALLKSANDRLYQAGVDSFDGTLHEYGTAGGLEYHYLMGQLPVRNYTTTVFPEYRSIDGQYLRTHFEVRPKRCWSCRLNHLKLVRVTEGPYTGLEAEEPEYECVAAWGPQIGVRDLGEITMLSNLADRLGVDANEGGWLVGWAMECYEKGILSRTDLDGLDLKWGNAEAVVSLLHKIARREGCGSWLAEGVMRAAGQVGGDAPSMGVYTLTGASPRGHDHRAWWSELLDTCLSNTSGIEASPAYLPDVPNVRKQVEHLSPSEVPADNANSIGWRHFEECLGACRYWLADREAVLDTFFAVTGRRLVTSEAIEIGERVANQLRAFNFRHGLDPAMEAPSVRYGSAPVDGPAAGTSIAPHFDQMKRDFWNRMGWEDATGKPLPQTLVRLDLADLVAELWPVE